MSNRILEFKWGTSRGRDTYGWTTCSLKVDGVRVTSVKGGGYDMKGAALGNWVSKELQEELKQIHLCAHRQCQKRKDGFFDYLLTPAETLYGMAAFYDERGDCEKVSVDGACGFDSVRSILEAMGYRLKYVNKDLYLLEKSPQEPAV